MLAKKCDQYSVFAGYSNIVRRLILGFCSLHGISGGTSDVRTVERRRMQPHVMKNTGGSPGSGYNWTTSTE